MVYYEIAYHLKIPMYELVENMPYEELLCWLDYFDRRPVDWRSDDRTFKLLQVQGYKGKPESVFQSLAALNQKRAAAKNPEGMIDKSNLKRSFLFNQLVSATGGEKLNFD
jgi:hypothetical protein